MTRHRLLRVSALLLILCCLAGKVASFGAESNPEAKTPRPKTVEELPKVIQAILTENHVPGAGIALVAKDHIIWAGGVGKADLAANKDVTADTMFRVGSVSKSFVALALLKLQEEGKIDLNARLKDIAPEIEVHNPWEPTNPVRVVNLLEHTAGFDDMHFNEVYNVQDPPDISLQEVFTRFPKPQYVRWPPSTRMAYSNPGYALAGFVIEKATGRPFEDYVQENILTPLGMTRSSFRLTPATRELLSQGYEGNPPHPVPYRNIYLRPAGNLLSSPAEMARFVQMMLNRGKLGDRQLVRVEAISRMEEPQTTLAARAGLKNGYGLGNYASLNHTVKEHGHDGGIGGFVSTYRYLPNQGLGYVVLINSSSPGKAQRNIVDLVFNYLTSGLPTAQQPPAKLSEAELSNFVGYYQPASPRNQLFAFLDELLGGQKLFVENGALYQKGVFAKRQALIPVSTTQVRLEKEPEAGGILCTTEDGTKVLAGGSFYNERVSPWWPGTRLAFILTSLVLMLSSPLFALIWIPRKVFGRMKGVKHLQVRAVPLLAVLSLVGAFFSFLRAVSGGNPGARDLASVSFCIGTWTFAFLSAWGWFLALRAFSLEMNRVVRIHSLLVAIACCGIAAYLAYWHIIGLQLWAW
jgi:CubicO group peptidase (beta-lactamase class C family)